MLDSGKMVGFVSIQDYDKARAFYEGKLGFDFVSQDQFAVKQEPADTASPQALHRAHPSLGCAGFAPGTVLGWEVDDVLATATWLKNRGVKLEKYPFAQDRELGIWTAPSGDKVAWFKDPDGNTLSVSQQH